MARLNRIPSTGRTTRSSVPNGVHGMRTGALMFVSVDNAGSSSDANQGYGAGEGNRTLVVSLGSFCSTIELHPQAGPMIGNRRGDASPRCPAAKAAAGLG